MTGINEDTAVQAMELVNEYHQKHLRAVEKKLIHAKTATRQCFADLSEMTAPNAEYNEAKPNETSEKVRPLETKYGMLWDLILRKFHEAQLVSEQALDQIDQFLLKLPSLIRSFYEDLVNSDLELMNLIQELAARKYKSALNAIETVQRMATETLMDIWPEVAQAEVAHVEVFDIAHITSLNNAWRNG
jgi:hypothetical protein